VTLPAEIFRQYDIRGTVGDQLTPPAARRIGQAYATLATERLGRAPLRPSQRLMQKLY
jgi:phosphomannomutase